jgi:hypothetical protein
MHVHRVDESMTRLLLVCLVGCASQPHTTTTPGVWTRDLANGESQRLLLFDSGIMGFQHVGPKLPISRAYGRWSLRDGKLELDIVGDEPDGVTMPPIDLARWTKRNEPALGERDWTYLVESR